VTVGGLTLSGASAGNYTLTQPAALTANITSPSLRIVASLPNIVIAWTTNATDFVLNQTAGLIPPVKWSPVTNGITVNGTNYTVIINASSGAKYFTLIAAPITSPSLRIAASLPNIVITWTTNATDFVLNQTAGLIPPVKWSPVTNGITVNGTNYTVIINAGSGDQYFMLIAAP
jgi:predicted TIM-barrel enzyme